jgi:hypothetical protein
MKPSLPQVTLLMRKKRKSPGSLLAAQALQSHSNVQAHCAARNRQRLVCLTTTSPGLGAAYNGARREGQRQMWALKYREIWGDGGVGARWGGVWVSGFGRGSSDMSDKVADFRNGNKRHAGKRIDPAWWSMPSLMT